jgi:hypothetical protein
MKITIKMLCYFYTLVIMWVHNRNLTVARVWFQVRWTCSGQCGTGAGYFRVFRFCCRTVCKVLFYSLIEGPKLLELSEGQISLLILKHFKIEVLQIHIYILFHNYYVIPWEEFSLRSKYSCSAGKKNSTNSTESEYSLPSGTSVICFTSLFHNLIEKPI